MAQAGNRAGKTQCYLQWWDSGAECLAVTAAGCKVCNRVLIVVGHIMQCMCARWFAKAGSTLRSSQAVPHPSTNRALRRLTSEVRRDPVHSTRYGRQRQRGNGAAEKRKSEIHIGSWKNQARTLNSSSAVYPGAKKSTAIRTEVTENPKSAARKSWQHPKVFPGGPPPQY